MKTRSLFAKFKRQSAFFPSAAFATKQSHGRRRAIATEETMAALRRELQARSEGGAGLGELLSYLKRANRRLGPRRRLTSAQLDELSLHCWALQASNPKGLLWGRARELWGGSQTPGQRREMGTGRRARRRATG